jgi:hypothetical protein
LQYVCDNPLFALTKEGENYFNSATFEQKTRYLNDGGIINPRINDRHRLDNGWTVSVGDIVDTSYRNSESLAYTNPNEYLENFNMPISRINGFTYCSIMLAFKSKNQKYVDKHYMNFIYRLVSSIDPREYLDSWIINRKINPTNFLRVSYIKTIHDCGYYHLLSYHTKMISRVSTNTINTIANLCYKIFDLSILLKNSRISPNIFWSLYIYIGWESFMQMNPSDEQILQLFEKYPQCYKIISRDYYVGPDPVTAKYLTEHYALSSTFYKRKLSKKLIKTLGRHLDTTQFIIHNNPRPLEKFRYLVWKHWPKPHQRHLP